MFSLVQNCLTQDHGSTHDNFNKSSVYRNIYRTTICWDFVFITECGMQQGNLAAVLTAFAGLMDGLIRQSFIICLDTPTVVTDLNLTRS